MESVQAEAGNTEERVASSRDVGAGPQPGRMCRSSPHREDDHGGGGKMGKVIPGKGTETRRIFRPGVTGCLDVGGVFRDEGQIPGYLGPAPGTDSRATNSNIFRGHAGEVNTSALG